MKVDKRMQIEKDMEDGIDNQLPRGYLGMSSAGHPCARYLWYSFRWCYTQDISKKHQRIFDRGFLEEPRIVRDLRVCGYNVTGQQIEMEGFAGHSKGHCDGVIHIQGEDHVLEIKTMKQEKFKVLKKDKMKVANPGYWGQAQMYMRSLELSKTIFIVTNKNTEERYYEIVTYDEHMAQFYADRIMDVISTEVPPAKIGNADWFECKWCDAAETCQYNFPHLETCRTCNQVEIHDDGVWNCCHPTTSTETLSLEQQERGCDKYHAFTSLSE